MSKQVKELVRNEVCKRFEGVESLAIADVTGIEAVEMNAIRARLGARDIRLMVVKNSVARQAFKTLGLASVVEMLAGPCAVAYGTGQVGVVTVVRELLDIQKGQPALEIKGAVLEGAAFASEAGIQTISKFPTRDEALGAVASCALAGGGGLSACILAPGAKVASLLKAIEERSGNTDVVD